MIRRPPRSTQSRSSAASDVYKRQEFIADIAHVVFEDEQVVRSGSEDCDDTVAGFLHTLRDRVQRGCSDTAAHAQHGSEPLDMCWSAQGAHDVVDDISGSEHGHLTRGLADGLADQRNGPHPGVCVANRHWNY